MIQIIHAQGAIQQTKLEENYEEYLLNMKTFYRLSTRIFFKKKHFFHNNHSQQLLNLIPLVKFQNVLMCFF